MQNPMQRLRVFLDPDNRWNDKTFEKVMAEFSAPPKKPHYNNINCALLDFAKQYGIAYEGAEPIDGKQYHMFRAPKGVSWEDIDTLRDVMTHLKIDVCIQHEKRPSRLVFDYQVICDETNNPPSVAETGNLNVDILLHGRHVSTDLAEMGIEWQGGASQNIDSDLAISFAQDAIDKHTESAPAHREEIALQLTTGLKPGEPETVATAYPSDIEERRAALAAENEEAGIGRGRLRPFEAPYIQSGRVSGATENPSSHPRTHEENAAKFFDVSRINPEFGPTVEVTARVTISAADLDGPYGYADKALRQAELQKQADELNEFRREVGRPATVTPAYLSALSAAHTRSLQKKVKTKTKNRKKR